MLNFYRRLIPKFAAAQATLHVLLQGNKKGKSAILWNDEMQKAFETCKQSLADAILSALPESGTPLAIVSDASDYSIGTVLQQRIDNEWQPLAFS